MSARRRRPGAILLLLLVAFAAGALPVVLQSPGALHGFDHELIRANRLMRVVLADLGAPLPGTPDLDLFKSRLKTQGVVSGAPIFVRIFKREFELELWMLSGEKFRKFATYPICKWSGALGPKLKQGDHQAPEGFYTVAADQLNPNSRWHRSFNLGFPNAFDRAHGRTGSFLMVHGGCSSVGCYAMTDKVIDEIWKLVTAALEGGQKRFQVQVFPFRMTDENLDRYKDSRHARYWRTLKPGYDLFEASRVPPKVAVCDGVYSFELGDTHDGSSPVASGCTSAPVKPS